MKNAWTRRTASRKLLHQRMLTDPSAAAGQSRARSHDLLGQLSAPMRAYLATESGSAGLLLTSTLLALAWANSPWSDQYFNVLSLGLSFTLSNISLGMDLQHWVNDGLITLFFFVIGLEVRHEMSVGELTNRRRAALPILAGIAGTLAPALIYVTLNPTRPAVAGWGVVIGTDTAFMLGALALVGPAIATQLRIFLLTLTVVDDLVAVAVIGLVYTKNLAPGYLAVVATALIGVALLSRRGTWRTAPYVVILIVAWAGTIRAGAHPSLTGMAAGLLIAADRPQADRVEQAASRFQAFRESPMPTAGQQARLSVQRAVSINARLQSSLHPVASYLIVPLFAFANAGVDLGNGALTDALSSNVTWGVCVGLVLGKLVGISVAVRIFIHRGLGTLPQGVRYGHAVAGAALSGIGFTVSLLIAALAFEEQRVRTQATVGILMATVLATCLGWLLFKWTRYRTGAHTADLPSRLSAPVDPARDHIRGRPDAPLTLVEYGDFQCPFCARATGVARQLHEYFGSDLRYVFRHLPLTEIHPDAEFAARAAEAAARQGDFWGMHDLLFAHSAEFTSERMASFAAQLGLDVAEFQRDLVDHRIAEKIQADVASAEASGARGTPTFFVGDRRYAGPHDTATLVARLEELRRSII